MSSKVTAFRVVMLNTNNVCHPGQILQGQVLVHLTSDLKMRGIKVTCRGIGRVAWNSGKIHHSSEEEYVNHEVTVFGHDGRSDVRLPASQHALPFELQLPPNIPSSFEQDNVLRGCTRYWLQAVIDRPWKSNMKCKTFITVNSIYDLNATPNLSAPVTKTTSKNSVCKGCLENDSIMQRWCCCCCPSDPLTVSFTLNKTGFVPGESIMVDSEISNYSDNTVSSSCLRLIMVITLKKTYSRGGRYAASVSIDEKKVISRIEHGQVNRGEKVQYTRDMLPIPPVPPTGLPGCNIIDISYFVRFTVQTSFKILEIDQDTDVTIGTVPLRSDVENIRQNNSANAIRVQPSAPIGPVISDIPPPTYRESTFGANHILDEDDNQDSGAFAPSYTYYDWMSKDRTDDLPTYESLFKDM